MAGHDQSPLGRKTATPAQYSPEVLFAIARAGNRRLIGVGESLPFAGEDVWTAWDLSWLEDGAKPAVAVATLRMPASSPNLVESKSLKLYLDSLAMTRFDHAGSVTAAIERDLSRLCEAPVEVVLTPPAAAQAVRLSSFPGVCIDRLTVDCEPSQLDAGHLRTAGGAPVAETLHSHLLRSVCPVTGQPDIGSILIDYRGPAVDRSSLLRYLVSYRKHADFHENCVERIFMDLKDRCAPAELSVYARYNRRGGLDINPFRSDIRQRAPDLRLWRQ